MRLRCFGRQITLSLPTRYELSGVIQSRRAWAAFLASLVALAVIGSGLAHRDRAGVACVLNRARTAAAAHAPTAWLQAKLGSPTATCRPTADGAAERADVGTLQLHTVPPGATIEVGGRLQGRTPLDLHVTPGAYDIRVRLTGFLDIAHRVEVGPGETVVLSSELWRSAPSVTRVRPASPGLLVADATFLVDGSLALTLAPPGSGERQAWVLSPAGSARRVGPPSVPGAIAVSPDGTRVAYLAPDQLAGGRGGLPATMGGRPARELWTADATGERPQRVFVLPAAGDLIDGEFLEDVRWSPDGTHVLLAARRSSPSGPPQTRLLWVDAARPGPAGGQAVELASLPGEVVPGTQTWSPSGDRVAFLTRTGRLTSLCIAAVAGPGGADAGFRYVADVAPAPPAQAPLPWAAPPAWSPDGAHLAYAAPAGARAPASALTGALAGLLGTSAAGARGALFDVDLSQPPGQSPDRLLLAAPDGAPLWPVWRSDGSVVALTRAATKGSYHFAIAAADGRVAARSPDTPNAFRPAQLPTPALPARNAAFAIVWDAPHAQALLAVSRPTTGFGAATVAGAPPDLWLLRFGAAQAQGVGQ